MARPQEFNTADALQKAMGVFWRKGYEATSLNDLLAATGLSKSSLYGTFGGKRELFLLAFDSYRADRTREMHLILGRGQARIALETFFRTIISDAQSTEFMHGCMSTNQAVELAPRDAEIKSRVEQDFRCIEEEFVKTIRRGQSDGSVKSLVDPQQLARLFIVAFPGFQVMVRGGASKPRMEGALTQLLRTLD